MFKKYLTTLTLILFCQTSFADQFQSWLDREELEEDGVVARLFTSNLLEVTKKISNNPKKYAKK